MNRQQRRATKQPAIPRPLKAKGTLYRFAGPIVGGLFNDNGEQVSPDAPDLDAFVEHFPFRTLLAPQHPMPIGGVWVVPDAEPVPVPQFILEAITEENHAGRSFLLLASKKEARDQARAAIFAVFGSAAGNA